MRVIKQQEQKGITIQPLCLSGKDGPAPRPRLPKWMEAAAAFHAGAPAQPTDPDVSQLERAAYDRGRQEAEKAALEGADRKIEEVMKRYAEGLMEIGTLKKVLYGQAEREVVKLALEVAKKIVHREIRVDREIVQTLVRVALDRVASKSPVSVRVNPADYDFLMETQRTAARPGLAERGVAFVPDRSVGRGGCLVETECGDVDARIEEEFREVEQAFFGGADREL